MKTFIFILFSLLFFSTFGQTFSKSSDDFDKDFRPYLNRYFYNLNLPEKYHDGYYTFYNDKNEIVAECLVRDHSIFKKIIFPDADSSRNLYTILKLKTYNTFDHGYKTIGIIDSTSLRVSIEQLDNGKWGIGNSFSGDLTSSYSASFYAKDTSEVINTIKIIEENSKGFFYKSHDYEIKNNIKRNEVLVYYYHTYSGEHWKTRNKKIDNVYVGFELFIHRNNQNEVEQLIYSDSTDSKIHHCKIYSNGRLTTQYKQIKKKDKYIVYKYEVGKLVSKDIFTDSKFNFGNKSAFFHKDYNKK